MIGSLTQVNSGGEPDDFRAATTRQISPQPGHCQYTSKSRR